MDNLGSGLRICLILNDAFSMLQFRGGLISYLLGHGFDVTLIVPPDDEYVPKLRALGVRVVEMPMARFISPLSDAILLMRLIRFFLSNRFDIVHTMTLKPNLYIAPVARACGVPRVVGLVSGAGFLFSESGRQAHPLLSRLVALFLRGSFLCMQKIWFQNADDLAHFVEYGICKEEKGVVIRSGGIDLEHYHPSRSCEPLRTRKRRELGVPEDCGIVLMGAARFIETKGVGEFADAARALLPAHGDWRFLLVAPDDPGSPDSLDRRDKRFQVHGLIIPTGFRSDLDELIAASDIVVLPSYYPEGVPRFLLEGLASGKPIVTTLSTGCRETVEDGENGFLVKPGEVEALSTAIEKLMEDPALREQFGRASRVKAENEFSQDYVCEQLLKTVYGVVPGAINTNI